MKKYIEKANTLIEAIPYIQKFYKKTFVIKCGGKVMLDKALKENFALDVILLKYIGVNPVIVHGGGPQIEKMMKKLGKDSKYVHGQRVTDDETMDIVEMVLGGVINKDIVSLINLNGGKAIGMTGKDGGLIKASRIGSGKTKGKRDKAENLGRVGEVDKINPEVIDLLDEGFIPVIAPIGVDRDGQSLNINADLAAGSLASALKAEKFVVLTDTEGILDEKNELLPALSEEDVVKLIKKGVIKEGMLPKVKCCLDALESGVSKVHIINGLIEHALLLEIFTDKGIGTEMTGS